MSTKKRPIVLEATKIDYTDNGVTVIKVTRYYCNPAKANQMMIAFACDGYSVFLTDRRCKKDV